MKITFDEVLSKSTYLQTEILGSVPSKVLMKVKEERCYDVKLVINGVECEPNWFNDVMKKIDEYIDIEARKIVRDKLDEGINKINKLHEIIEDVNSNIIDEFKLDTGDYDY